jgi:hypothetical protein
MIEKNELYSSISSILYSKNRNVMNLDLSIFFNKREIKDFLYFLAKVFNQYKKDRLDHPLSYKEAFTQPKDKNTYTKVISYYLPKLTQAISEKLFKRRKRFKLIKK